MSNTWTLRPAPTTRQARGAASGRPTSGAALGAGADPIVSARGANISPRRTDATMTGARHRYDAIVVGARCAGAATAMLLARRGFDVLLVDRARFPSEIPHGHYIRTHGPPRLAAWGLLDRVLATGCPPITSITMDLGDFPLTGRSLAGAPGWACRMLGRRHRRNRRGPVRASPAGYRRQRRPVPDAVLHDPVPARICRAHRPDRAGISAGHGPHRPVRRTTRRPLERPPHRAHRNCPGRRR